MIGLILIAHGRLGAALLDSAALIIGPQQRACAIALERGRDLDAARAEVVAALAEVGCDGDGVLVMTDMFGGTPTNLSVDLLATHPLEILAGVNLPMVMKFFGSREAATLAELAQLLRGYGQQGIVRVADLLQEREARQREAP